MAMETHDREQGAAEIGYLQHLELLLMLLLMLWITETKRLGALHCCTKCQVVNAW